MSRRKDWHSWTADEEEFIIKNYNKIHYSVIAKKLNLRISQIKSRAQRLGLFIEKKELRRRRTSAGIKNIKGAHKNVSYEKIKTRMIKEWECLLRFFPEKEDEMLTILNQTHE